MSAPSALGPLLQAREGGYFAFFCPGCGHGHAVTIAWTISGTPEAPTISPSVLVNPGRECPEVPRCHLFVEAGQIRYLSDCDHSLAGQTVPMEPI